ncbi:MAG: sigma-70 family RNA polymerase sigma factor [Actinomycetota bacterium]|nr:sigma-70 family RNA polymerase sigma factor [Actinomycetota bacterium]
MSAVDPLTRLAVAAQAGDDGALDQLVELAYEQVWRLCASLVDEASASDLAQDTFLRAVRALPRFRAEASARTWLLSIARCACMDELRGRTRRRRRDQALVPAAGSAALAADAAGEVLVADLLARLDPDRRSAFVLTQVLGLTCEEAAEVCECPAGTIRSRVARARDELIAHLGDERPAGWRSRRGGTTLT